MPHPVLIIVAALMVTCGIAEVITGFRQIFFSVRTTPIAMAAYLGAALGVLYILAGILVLTTKKSAATLALSLVAAVILGLVAMVVTDLLPTDTVSQLFAIVLGMSIACAFIVVVALKWDAFL